MANLRTLLAVAFVVAVIAGCGSESDEVAFDPAGAESCQQLAVMFVGSHQRMLEALGTATDADMGEGISPDIRAAGEEVNGWFVGSAGARIADLCSGGGEQFEALACEEASTLVPQGEAGERYLRETFPPCE